MLEQLPEKADIAVILSPQLTTLEFLETIVQELHCAPPTERTVKAQIDVLNVALMRAHAEGRRVVLIVDEAQTLSPELLEQVRLLTNLETSKQKLLQIILIGQPELRELLDRPEMRQIAQRITGRYHLEPLTKDDTRAYVNHRLRVAGAQSDIFSRSAINALYSHARGIPRLINVIADRALLAAYTQERRSVDARLVAAAAAEVFGIRRRTPWWPIVTGVTGVVAVVFGVGNLGQCAARRGNAARRVHERRAGAERYADDDACLSRRRRPRRYAGHGGRGAGRSARPAPVTLQSLLADPAFIVGTDAAIGELLALWGAHYDSARGEPCEQAQEQGLRCLFQRRGSLGELRRVNWPTILSLVTADGAEHPVVVAALGYDHAQIVANGNTSSCRSRSSATTGSATTCCSGAPATRRRATCRRAPMTSACVGCAKRSRSSMAARTSAAASSTYDDALEQRVRAYQRAHQLTVDGIVGARTQIAMLAELGLPNTPALVEDH